MPHPTIKIRHNNTPTRTRTEVAWRLVVLNNAMRSTMQTADQIASAAQVSRRTVMNMRAALKVIGLKDARKLTWFDAAQHASTLKPPSYMRHVLTSQPMLTD